MNVLENMVIALDGLQGRQRTILEDVYVVYVDVVNNKTKPRAASNILEIYEAAKDNSKPIGLVTISYAPMTISQVPFVGISTSEEEVLTHALAEIQDSVSMGLNEEDE